MTACAEYRHGASAVTGCAAAPTQPSGDRSIQYVIHAPGDPVIAIFIATRAVASHFEGEEAGTAQERS